MEQTQIPDLDTVPEGAVAAPGELDLPQMQQHPFAAAEMRAAAVPGDENLMVEFYRHPKDGLDRIRIRIPGDKLYQPDFMATDHYKRRFAAQWQAYQNQMSQLEGQTLLTDCAWIDEGMRNELATFGIKTVEGLSGVSDGNLDQIGPGARTLRDRARTFVEEKQKLQQFDTQAAENARLKQQLDEMGARLAALEESGQAKQPASGAKK